MFRILDLCSGFASGECDNKSHDLSAALGGLARKCARVLTRGVIDECQGG